MLRRQIFEYQQAKLGDISNNSKSVSVSDYVLVYDVGVMLSKCFMHRSIATDDTRREKTISSLCKYSVEFAGPAFYPTIIIDYTCSKTSYQLFYFPAQVKKKSFSLLTFCCYALTIPSSQIIEKKSDYCEQMDLSRLDSLLPPCTTSVIVFTEYEVNLEGFACVDGRKFG